MRVSTSQFYFQSTQLMSQKTADVNDQMAHLSSSKRVLTAKDDAISYSTLSGFNDDLANIEKYKRNITMAENNNSMQEVIFADVETLLDTFKQDMLLANNGRMSDEDLQSIASQMRNSLDQLIDLANSQDEQGDYIFSGYQTEQQPFSQQVDGSVVYSGDKGVNELQIAKNINIATNQPGDDAFLNVENAIGDFTANYPNSPANTSGVTVESANITDRHAYNGSTPHSYTFTFGPGADELNVLDGVTNVYSTTSYSAGQNIPLSNGVDVTLSGNPLPGENFTLSETAEISVFETLNNAISWVEQGATSNDIEQHQVDYNTMLNQLSTAMNHISSRRADAGIRLQVLENQQSRHLDIELNITTNKAGIEDLDFAKAISEFEQSQVALQVSQQTFSKLQNLSLFNYL
jgi:flagellar hook-associated protein 3 FlgL